MQLGKQQKTNKQRRTKDNMLGWQAPDWDIDSCALDNPDGALDCQPFENPLLKNATNQKVNGPFSDFSLVYVISLVSMLNNSRPFKIPVTLHKSFGSGCWGQGDHCHADFNVELHARLEHWA